MLHSAWQIWKRFGEFMGNLIGRLILTVFYFTVFVPFATGIRLFKDPLEVNRAQGSYWHRREKKVDTLEQAKKQS